MGTTPLLTEPLRWALVAVFAVALGLHLRHAVRAGGTSRLWHGGHAVMAAAMACMVVPGALATTSAPLWFIATGGAAGAALVHALLRRWDGDRVGVPWITLGVGLAVTAYMCLMTTGIAAAPLTWAAVAWVGCEAVGWFTGVLSRRPAVALGATAVDRVALGLLALGTAYLFVAMQEAMQQMPMV
jgi:hypothetical protein